MSEKPQQDSAQEAGKKKRKGSSFYVYLVILFGAAFMLLLLAYFVQQRSSQTTISDLRNSMTLSQDEQQEDIRRLEAENELLRQDVAELQENFSQSVAQAQILANRLQETSDQLAGWANFWAMDSAFRAEDYETCAGFFQDEPTYRTYADLTETQDRTEEIYQELVRLGYLLEEDEPAQ